MTSYLEKLRKRESDIKKKIREINDSETLSIEEKSLKTKKLDDEMDEINNQIKDFEERQNNVNENYTKVLEFFIENGIQLTHEQIKSLKEATDEQIYQVLKNKKALNKFDPNLAKSINVSGAMCRRSGNIINNIDKRIDKITDHYHKGENDKAKKLKDGIDDDIKKSGIDKLISNKVDDDHEKALQEEKDRKEIEKIIKK